jgi:hypothetical protein
MLKHDKISHVEQKIYKNLVLTHQSGFRLKKMQDHKSIAKQLLPLRNTFAIAMSDYMLGRINEQNFLSIRNEVSQKADAIYAGSPEVSRRIVLKAKEETRKYLEKNADYLIRNKK